MTRHDRPSYYGRFLFDSAWYFGCIPATDMDDGAFSPYCVISLHSAGTRPPRCWISKSLHVVLVLYYVHWFLCFPDDESCLDGSFFFSFLLCSLALYLLFLRWFLIAFSALLLRVACRIVVVVVSLRHAVPVHFSVETVDSTRRSDRDNITSSNHRSAGIERVKSYSPSAHRGRCADETGCIFMRFSLMIVSPVEPFVV